MSQFQIQFNALFWSNHPIQMLLFSLLSFIFSREHKVLVLLDDTNEKSEYSTFFNDLQLIGCNLTYKVCGSKTIPLERFENHIYGTVIILCSKSTCISNNGDDLKDYLDNGGNAIVFNGVSSNIIQEKIYSHLNYRITTSHQITDINDNSQVVLRKIVAPKDVVPSKVEPLIFEGGYATIERPNDFRFPIVIGGLEHKVSTQDKIIYSQAVASEMIPISAFQARTAGRIIIIHSHNFASNSIYDTKVTLDENMNSLSTPIENGNRQLMIDLAKWVTHYNSHVKIVSATHYDTESHVAPVQYHIKQSITVVANLSYVVNGEWQPYQGNDVQVEIFMLGTFIRHHMKLTSPGQYTDTLILPDRAGNYWIKVFTSKEGWMNAREEMAIAVRPLAIREKEKFLVCAQPYQYSMVLIMAATFLGIIHFLYHKPSN